MHARDLLPWRDFVIETSWSPGVASTEMKNRIGPRRFYGGGGAPFVGESLTGAEFRFRRAIAYRNSFLPHIRVAVEPAGDRGARVHVRMQLHPAVLALTVIWLVGMTIAVIAQVTLPWHRQHGAPMGLAMPGIGIVVVALSFGLEARKAEAMLRAIYAPAPALKTNEPYR
jgi:hypothetical protein